MIGSVTRSSIVAFFLFPLDAEAAAPGVPLQHRAEAGGAAAGRSGRSRRPGWRGPRHSSSVARPSIFPRTAVVNGTSRSHAHARTRISDRSSSSASDELAPSALGVGGGQRRRPAACSHMSLKTTSRPETETSLDITLKGKAIGRLIAAGRPPFPPPRGQSGIRLRPEHPWRMGAPVHDQGVVPGGAERAEERHIHLVEHPGVGSAALRLLRAGATLRRAIQRSGQKKAMRSVPRTATITDSGRPRRQ
jgi:hypothetical protein